MFSPCDWALGDEVLPVRWVARGNVLKNQGSCLGHVGTWLGIAMRLTVLDLC